MSGAAFAPGALRLSGAVMRLTGWPPDAFWAATPAEVAALIAPNADPPAAPLGRADMIRLMENDDDR